LRDDGSVLEISPGGVQITREDARTRYDNPGGTLLADDSHVLALDAPERWSRDGLSLIARAPLARFDVTVLRYERVQIELAVQGAAELLLRRADGAERVIQVGAERVGPAFCQITGNGAQTLVVERDGASVTIRAGNTSRRCTLDGLSGPVGLALRALDRGVRITSLKIARQ
jgi:hypothetical protein